MNFLKKQGVAWVITAVMIVIAIFIGRADTSAVDPRPEETVPIVSTQPDSRNSYVRDDAGVLTASEIKKLDNLNADLLNSMDVAVACVTTNYGRDDLYSFALDYADRLGLGIYDFIIVLDISGENYWLVQGAGLQSMISDTECGDYAWNYLEDDFARGDYGEGLISLVEALSDWYWDHY